MHVEAKNRPARTAARRDVVILVYPGVQSLDVTGPLEVFTGAQQLLEAQAAAYATEQRDGGYRVLVVSPDGAPVETSSGLTIVSHTALAQAPAAIDTLIVAGVAGIDTLCEDRATLDWIAARARDARRIASVCTGAFALAAAGLLDGRR